MSHCTDLDAADNNPAYDHDTVMKIVRLGTDLIYSYNASGDVQYLDSAVMKFSEAADLLPLTDDDNDNGSFDDFYWSCRFNLASALSQRALGHGRLDDLNRAIDQLRPLVALCPTDHSLRFGCLDVMARSLGFRFQLQGHKADLEESIPMLREAAELLPPDFPSFVSMQTLAHALTEHFRLSMDPNDINEAISCYRSALEHCPIDNPCLWETQGNFCRALCQRFKMSHDMQDIDEATSFYRIAVDLCPATHPDRWKVYNNLACAFSDRFEASRSIEDLDEAISCLREAFGLSIGSSGGSRIWRDLGLALLERFLVLEESHDLDEAIAWLEQAVEVGPTNNGLWQARHGLGQALFQRFKNSADIEALHESISLLQQSVERCPADTTELWKAKANLADALFERYLTSAVATDLGSAISLYQEVLSLGIPELNCQNIANSLGRAFDELFRASSRDPRDLDETILRFREDILLRSTDSDIWDTKRNLGHALKERFALSKDPHDLSEAILVYEEAINSCPATHTELWTIQRDLGDALSARFEKCGTTWQDLDAAILSYQGALKLCPVERLPLQLQHNLSHALVRRWRRSHRPQDLDEAISLLRQIMQLYPVDPNRPAVETNLGLQLLNRFHDCRDIQILDEGILCLRHALDASSAMASNRTMLHSYLGHMFVDRYEVSRDGNDLDEAVSQLREVVDIRPLNQSDRREALRQLARALRYRSKASRKLHDLDEALKYHRELVRLSPHSDRANSLINLAGSLDARFKWTKDTGALSEAIETYREALSLDPQEPDLRARLLNNYGWCLLSILDSSGNAEDLEEPMKIYQEAISLPSQGSRRSHGLNGLANCLQHKFQFSGDIRVMDDEIQLRRQALEHCPSDQDERSIFLHALGQALDVRFRKLGMMTDYNESIRVHQEALELRPVGHPGRWESLFTLGMVLSQHPDSKDEALSFLHQALSECGPENFMYRAVLLTYLGSRLANDDASQGDFDKGTQMLKEAITISHGSHKHVAVLRMAGLYSSRFRRSGDTHDLNECIRCYEEAGTMIPPDHPQHGEISASLALAYLSENPPSHDPFSLFEKAVAHKTSSAQDRFHYALWWADEAYRLRHSSSIQAYSQALLALDRLLVSYPTAELLHQILAQTPRSIASNACAVAVDAGQIGTAVELLEQGRGLLWARLTRYRHPLDELKQVDIELACKFETASQQLERLAMSSTGHISNSPTSSSHLSGGALSQWGLAQTAFPTFGTRYSRLGLGQDTLDLDLTSLQAGFEQQMRLVHEASETWDEVVEKIRQVDGFSNFLRAVPFSELQTVAANGPVIIVNVSEHRCDAIIIHDIALPPVLIPLPDVTPGKLDGLSEHLDDSLDHLHRYPPDVEQTKREKHEAATYRAHIKDVLRSLWSCVVQPVAEKLSELGCKPQSRVWWYPTGALCRLPLHAAGLYQSGQPNFHDMYISSYITTLGRFLQPKACIPEPDPVMPEMLVIGVPGDPNEKGFLPSVEEEICAILDTVPSGISPNVLLTELATPDAVQSALPAHSWVHFTCHGYQNPRPLESFFLLHGGIIKLIDLVKSRLPRAELAILSACNTATGDYEKTPDEVIHLAAAMQFCGFRSVVGTLWPMRDKDGPDVARQFYSHMFRRDGIADFRDSAEALHQAVKSLREKKVPIDCWINFVHFGF